MTALSIFDCFVQLNGLVLVAWLAVSFLSYLGQSRRMSFRDVNQISRVLLLSVFLIPLFLSFFPTQNWISPAAQIWSAGELDAPAPERSELKVSLFGLEQKSLGFEQSVSLGQLCFVLLLVGWLVSLGRVLKGQLCLLRFYRTSLSLHSLGSVYIGCAAEISIPISYRLLNKKIVLLPLAWLERSQTELNLILKHELQHHRQGDTLTVYWLEILKTILFFNPFVYLLGRHLERLHEFACDESLVDQHNVSPQAYGRCLIQAAQLALDSGYQPTGAVGLVPGSSGALLRRRILMLLGKPTSNNQTTRFLSVAVLSFLMASLAFASRGMVKDRRVTLSEARTMLENVEGHRDFPLVVNERVLAQLNRFLGTPEGRKRMREGLQRMNNYSSLLSDALSKYSLPSELRAIALVESGYQNLPKEVNPVRAAGLWQFIQGTAIRYNLRVDEQIDERLNVVKSTSAAFRYLSALNLRFEDWGLAVLGYNTGEGNIEKGIRETGSRDPWVLIEEGFTNDPNYLSSVMAAILIMNNPSTLN